MSIFEHNHNEKCEKKAKFAPRKMNIFRAAKWIKRNNNLTRPFLNARTFIFVKTEITDLRGE